MHPRYLAAIVLLASAGCATAADKGPPPLTAKQQQELTKALEGKTAGAPQSCVPLALGSNGLHAVSDSVLIYKVNKDLTYRNDLFGSCSGISRGNTMVLKPTNNQYCRGDIVRSVDLSIGMPSGSCALGDFVPYHAPKK